MKKIVLFVEGETDKIIIQNILIAARYPIDRIDIEVSEGKQNVIKFAKNKVRDANEHTIVAAFVDSDTTYVKEAIEQVKKRFEGSQVEIFFAVPTIESWVFADDILLKKQIPVEFQQEALRMPMPEEIYYPKIVLNKWLSDKHFNFSSLGEKYNFLAQINISRAVARCSSLSYFLQRVGELLDLKSEIIQPIENGMANTLPRHIFANLLKEVAFPDTVVFKTLSGHNITVEELKNAVEEDSDVGKEYIGRVLRVARDIIKNQTNKI